MKRNYDDEAKHASKAIQIAFESYQKYRPTGINDVSYNLILMGTAKDLKDCLHPQPQYRKISSLKQLVADVFIYFQEGHGPAVEYFWQRIQEENLGYVRVNRMEKVLKRGRISSQIEYDFVIDTMVPYKQQGMLTDDEFEALNTMIGAFEQKGKKR